MNDRHEHLEEGAIHAWLDGALPPDESARVEQQAAACADCSALVAEARGLVAASSRILSLLDAVPGAVIPGVDAGADQLAVLRARRQAASRRWWRDRRIVAAASLLFVAGASSLVWRSSLNPPSAAVIDERLAASPAPAAPRVAAAESEAQPVPNAASPREASSRDAKVEAPAPLRDAAPVRLTATRPADSATEQKAVLAGASLARGSPLAANEARRADSVGFQRSSQVIDSTSVVARADRARSELPLQQGAASQRQTFEQSARPAAPPAALAPQVGVVVTGVTGRTRPVTPAGSCYQLQVVSPDGRPSTTADTVTLFDEMVPERSDPSWFRARRLAALAETTLVWRSVDSTTVELRTRGARESQVVRFSTAGSGVPVPDVRALTGVRAAVALKVGCP